MAKIETFGNMEVWQQARGLVKHIYDLNYLGAPTFQALKEKLTSVSRQLSAFMKYLNNARKQL
jgi:hypothetical protein